MKIAMNHSRLKHLLFFLISNLSVWFAGELGAFEFKGRNDEECRLISSNPVIHQMNIRHAVVNVASDVPTHWRTFASPYAKPDETRILNKRRSEIILGIFIAKSSLVIPVMTGVLPDP